MKTLHSAGGNWRRTRVATAVTFSLFGIGLTNLAHGQTEATKGDSASLDRIVVTGSKIKGVDLASAVPVRSVSRKEIDSLGVNSMDQLLQTLNVMGQDRGYATGDSQNAYASLRGIGRSRTLVLVNGHRWVGSADLNGLVNLNSIPLGAVDRIEVLLDGGSVLYGADAMVGLINVILKDQSDGFEARVRASTYGAGAASRGLELSAGHTGERFSGTVSYLYSQAEGLEATAYPLTTLPGPDGTQPLPDGSRLYWLNTAIPAGRFQVQACSVPLVNNVCPAGKSILTDPNKSRSGSFFTYDAGRSGSNWRLNNQPTDSYNPREYLNLLQPYTRHSLVGSMKYNFSDNLQFKVSAQFSDDRTARAQTPAAINSSTAFTIAPNNYYNPFGMPVTTIQRLVTEMNGRPFESHARTLTVSPSLMGDFELAGRTFDWELGFMAGRVDQVGTSLNETSASRLKNAIGPTSLDANGKPVCGAAGNVIPGCVPANLLGANTLTGPMLDYLRTSASGENRYRNTDYFLQFSSSDLFKLPAGSVGIAGGFERHVQSGEYLPDDLNQQGDFVGGAPQKSTQFKQGSTESFAELYVPLLKDLPLIKKLDLSLAGRDSKFDSGATTFNKKFGLKWKINDDVALRGSYSTGFRFDIPAYASASRISFSNISSIGSVVDPCSYTTNAANVVTATSYGKLNPEQQQQCQKLGSVVPNVGLYDTRGKPAVQVERIGNSDIKPETDVFRTVGMLFSPSQVKGLDLSVDFWSVKFRDSIYQTTFLDMLTNCLAEPNNSRVCPSGAVVRDATGVPTYVRTTWLNTGGNESYQGYDFRAVYELKRTSWGNFKFDWNNTLVTKFQNALTPMPEANKVGYYFQTAGIGAPQPRLRSTLSIGLAQGSWGVQWTGRYSSSLIDRCDLVGRVDNETVNLCNQLGPVQGQDLTGKNTYLPFLQGGSAHRLGGYTIHDLYATYSTPWLGGGRISGGVRNAFNKQPPRVMSSSTNGLPYDPGFGPPDRNFYVEYRQKF